LKRDSTNEGLLSKEERSIATDLIHAKFIAADDQDEKRREEIIRDEKRL